MKTWRSGGSVGVLICRGNLDAMSMIHVKNRLAHLLHQKCKRLILDLGKAKQADCSGLSILMDRLQKIRALDGDIRAVNVQPEVSRTFDRLGVNRVMEVFGSKQEAIKSYGFAA